MCSKNDNMSIYLVSLNQDVARREKLKERFPQSYASFRHIEAIDGRVLPAKEYFDKTRGFFNKYKRIMTPAELGCTLSHIKALQKFLSTDARCALIIEDDIIGEDTDFRFIETTATKEVGNGIMFCGCQEGLLLRYKYGKPITESLLKVAHTNRGEFSRTAAYVVSREAAQTILDFHNNNFITVADFWFDLLKKFRGDVYYLDVISHPIDLSNSSIENERLIVQRSLLRKVFSKDVFSLLIRRFAKELKLLWYRFHGHKRVNVK